MLTVVNLSTESPGRTRPKEGIVTGQRSAIEGPGGYLHATRPPEILPLCMSAR